MVVSVESFRLHLREFSERFEVVPLRDLVVRLTGAKKPERPLLAVTFDDGWIDTFEYAVPELEAAGLTATVFAAVQFVQAAADGQPFIGRAGVIELARRGFEIGSHTWSHRELMGVDDAVLEHELIDSRKWLEDLVGHPVVSFAYPKGIYDVKSAIAVRRSYDCAVTVERGFCARGADLALLPRIGIHDDMTSNVSRLRWRLAGLP